MLPCYLYRCFHIYAYVQHFLLAHITTHDEESPTCDQSALHWIMIASVGLNLDSRRTAVLFFEVIMFAKSNLNGVPCTLDLTGRWKDSENHPRTDDVITFISYT